MKYQLNKLKLLLFAVGIVFLGVVVSWFKLFGNLQPDKNNSFENQVNTSITPSQKLKVNLLIDFGGGKTTSYENVEVNENDTVYSLLVKKTKETNYEVTTKTYDFGLMVESINGVSASSSNYWSYSVNGQMGNVAADKFILNDGDKVEWKYTPIQ